ncbi:MAG: SufS family cysteine desulfurase [Myxococcales bacterium]|nr:SufS family cysteine desulfurase [Myxococcales bacterium]
MDARSHDAEDGDRRARAIRAEFPAFGREVNGKPLVYLDSASTTQKPDTVIDALREAYAATANIHRGVHTLSSEVTRAYEAVRGKIASLLGARDARGVVFVRGTTEAINLVAQSYGRAHVGDGDEVVVTELEHHSNIVPWQMLCRERGARLRVLPIDDRGQVILAGLEAILGPRTRLVALSHVSNSLGTVLPVAEITRRAKAVGATVLVDGAQAAAHLPVDVEALGCDFYAFSGHKVYGPTGVGALWGRTALLDAMPPWQGGGDMVRSVRFEDTTYQPAPHKFEAGTPDIVGVIGLGAAVDWFLARGPRAAAAREAALLDDAIARIGALGGVRLVGTAADRVGSVSFVVDGLHAHDVGTLLDLDGIAVRTGHHCAQPVMDRYGVDATVRVSLGIYSTRADIDALVSSLARVRAELASPGRTVGRP